MLDALLPFASVFADSLEEGRSSGDALERAARAAEKGAEATASMLPKRGRSSYLGDRAIGHQDPGATAAAIWLRAVVSAI
jgi:dihydroxyacetone kinase